MRASTSPSSAGLTRSVLLMMMTSAKAIWFLASGASRRRWESHFASATVDPAFALHQALDDADKVPAHGAADAAVVHLEHFFVCADDELVVDADLAKLVDHDRVALAVRLAQNAVEQRRLASAQIAGEDSDGNFFRLVA